MSKYVPVRRGLTGGVLAALVAAPLAVGLSTAPAQAASSTVVVNEVYVNGGSSGAAFTSKFVELRNLTGTPVDLSTMSLQYRAPTSTANSTSAVALTGTIPANGYFTLVGGSNGSAGSPVTGNQTAAGFNPGGAGGTVSLVTGTAAVNPSSSTSVVDKLGYGTSNTPEGAASGAGPTGNSVTMSLGRSGASIDTDVNTADFTAQTPTPGAANSGGGTDPDPDPEPGEVVPIAAIQGEGATTPVSGQSVTTEGVVTAAYPSGGLNGFYLQTGGPDTTPNASDGVFVYGGTSGFAAATPEVGDSVQVTGTAGEFGGVTQITATAAGLSELTTALPAPVAKTTVPGTDCAEGSCASTAELDTARERVEGELFQPTGDYTATDVYDGSAFTGSGFSSSMFGEIGLAAESDVPLYTPTDVVDAQDTAGIAARTAYNDAHRILLDDGSTANYTAAANTGTPFPYFTADHTVGVGADVAFPEPVVLTYGFGAWRFQPQGQVNGAPEGIDIEQDRPALPEDVGGDLKLATFNVLNYFTTLGVDYTGGTCTRYNDRAGNPVTVNQCPGNGPRGAWNQVNLERQQAKIVDSINKLDADVVTLEEIENSRSVTGATGGRDAAVATLVEALNAAAGGTTPRWDYVVSPSELPAQEDVIRNAIIFDPSTVELVGDSQILVGVAAFSNARQPFAQTFKATGGDDADGFAVIVNHFKSKGSGVDDGTGQGDANPDRVAQAGALVDFADEFATDRGVEKVFLTGDFNAYSFEDPVQVIEDAGYTNLDSDDPTERSYNFDGAVGSLDHVFANEAALADVSGVDVWTTNAYESVYYEYSRFNYNVSNLYAANPFRASDHNPEIVGINAEVEDPNAPAELNLLNINDFHGRIDANTTRFATTIEQLRAAGGEDNTLLLSAGDNIGASLFASSVQQDEPAIDVLNALDLASSAVGNHEFDQGFDDLTDRVVPRAEFSYLGANVYGDDGEPVLPEYDTFEVDGLTVGVIGVVTEETSSLVSPAGIEGITFGDPVEAVNRVAAELTDGDPANGEADVLVAEYHEGAPGNESSAGQPPAGESDVFDAIVEDTSAEVDAIFTGHTHRRYAFAAPVPGEEGVTRPIVQTGNYGEFVGQVGLTVDRESGEVTAHTQRNVARVAAEDLSYPRVAEVKQITDAALAFAAEIGNQPVAEITDDITTAFSGGSYVDGEYAGGTRDDRSQESTLGDLVATALRDGVSDFAEPDLGLTNSGGLRDELLFAGNTTSNPANTDGVVTFAEANAVLPFNNTVALVDLTGAQLKTVLEQQWQTAADGTVPSRAYLQLGMSDNVRVTADPTNPAGERITSVFIDDVPIDPAATYTVSTLSFLAAGGDNFRGFTAGSNFEDLGLLDAELFRDYLAGNSPLSPDFARQQVFESGLPAEIVGGEPAQFQLGVGATTAPVQPVNPKTLNLTSLGSPANTSVVATVGDTEVGTFPVTDGIAQVDLTVPDSVQEGDYVTFTARPSGTTVTVPFTPAEVVDPEPVTTTLTARTTYPQVKVGAGSFNVVATVAASGGYEPTGTVTVRRGGKIFGTAQVVDGQARISAGPFTSVGELDLTVEYSGDDVASPATTTVPVTVTKAKPDLRVTAASPVRNGARPSVFARLSVEGLTVAGRVEFTFGAQTVIRRLDNERAQVRLPRVVRNTRVTVRYLGNAVLNPVQTSTTVRVQR